MIAAAILCLSIASSATACPVDCACFGKTVDCRSRGLAIIPTGIPLDTEVLLLDDNKLTSLNSITSLVNLTTLSASKHSIGIVDYQSTWQKLRPTSDTFPVLKFLNLSHNSLVYLNSTTIGLLSNIEVLDFTNNPIATVFSYFIQTILPLPLVDFRISSKEYTCGCWLISFRNWYTSRPFTNADRDEDLNTCRCPLSLSGRTLNSISMHDMECPALGIDICLNVTGLGKGAVNDYRVHNEQKVTAIDPIATTIKNSELGCLIECHHTENCYRVSYAANTDSCRLYPFSLYDNDTSIGKSGWKYTRLVPGVSNLNKTYHLP